MNDYSPQVEKLNAFNFCGPQNYEEGIVVLCKISLHCISKTWKPIYLKIKNMSINLSIILMKLVNVDDLVKGSKIESFLRTYSSDFSACTQSSGGMIVNVFL